jgi:hypothetical protein
VGASDTPHQRGCYAPSIIGSRPAGCLINVDVDVVIFIRGPCKFSDVADLLGGQSLVPSGLHLEQTYSCLLSLPFP